MVIPWLESDNHFKLSNLYVMFIHSKGQNKCKVLDLSPLSLVTAGGKNQM
jgi:hypothetical protein